MSRRGMICVAFLVMLAVAGTASAAVITVPLDEFLVFSGGGSTGGDAGFETQIAGASLYIGNIGSNWDLRLGASETQILGSVYAGRKVDLAPRSAVGSDGNPSTFQLESPLGTGFPTYAQQWERVVANGEATLRDETKIWDTLDAGSWSTSGTPTVGQTVDVLDPAYYTIGAGADTFALISMPGTSFTHDINTHPDQSLSGAGDKTIAPGHWGDLTTTGDQTILLSSGDYYFDSIDTTGDKITLKIDLTSGTPINIYSVDEMKFGGQDNELMVKGPGMTDYVLIRDASELAALINWETRDTFTLGGGTGNPGGWGSIWGGTVYSTLASGVGVDVGQHIDWYGSLWAYDTIDLADHSRYTYVSGSEVEGVIPEPSTVLIWSLLAGLGICVGWRRRKR